MFSFFIPTSKVQKDRRIMHETDARMAKYSRRGLVFNFLAYLICLMGGRFIDENRDLTVTLTIGLLLITLLRGFFLFRFDQLYPRAPQRWRNSYFVATLLGAFWWAVILVSVTLKLSMTNEAPLLWLYTVVFFSTTAHAFAPYQKFLSYYQFFGLVPAAFSAFFVGEVTSHLYAVLMLVFYLILTHQCRLISENYWERLEAAYALARKTQSIEEEKRDTRASAQLNREFLGCLRADLHTIVAQTRQAMRDMENGIANQSALKRCERDFERVFEDVSDFNNVLNKELALKNKVFNIRHELQHIVAEYIDDAEFDGIYIETSLSPTLPMRLKGDASRLSQVIRTLLSHCIKNMDKGIILFEVEFLREYETAGELYLNISSYSAQQRKRFFSDDSDRLPQANLSFAVARGIAELMNGSIEINEIPNEGVTYRMDAKFDIADQTGQLDFHKNTFQNNRILLVHKYLRILDAKRRELNALGFTVFTESNYKKAQLLLVQSYKDSKPIDSVLFFADEGDVDAKEFNNALIEHPELRYTHQLIAASKRQQRILANQGFIENDYVQLVDKPVGLFELETAFKNVYASREEEDEALASVDVQEIEPAKAKQAPIPILLISRREQARTVVGEALANLPNTMECITEDSKLAATLNKQEPQVILIDCDEDPTFIRVVDTIREAELSQNAEVYVPILGISSSSRATEGTAYELGVDDFIDLTNPNKNLKRIIQYWASLNNFGD